LVLQIGGDQYFALLSYANGSTAIHRAIDETGTIGSDWWGIAHEPSLEGCLATFAQEQKLSLEALRAAVGCLVHSAAEEEPLKAPASDCLSECRCSTNALA
jgi:hypothetical protein